MLNCQHEFVPARYETRIQNLWFRSKSENNQTDSEAEQRGYAMLCESESPEENHRIEATQLKFETAKLVGNLS